MLFRSVCVCVYVHVCLCVCVWRECVCVPLLPPLFCRDASWVEILFTRTSLFWVNERPALQDQSVSVCLCAKDDFFHFLCNLKCMCKRTSQKLKLHPQDKHINPPYPPNKTHSTHTQPQNPPPTHNTHTPNTHTHVQYTYTLTLVQGDIWSVSA